MENVKKLVESDVDNVVWLSEQLHELGYVLIYDILKSTDFGLPQSRTRFYAPLQGSWRAWGLEHLHCSVQRDLHSFLLADDEKYLVPERQRRQESQMDNSSEGGGWKNARDSHGEAEATIHTYLPA